MTIDEKLDLFYKTAIDEATRESISMLSDYEESLNERYQLEKDLITQKARQAYERQKVSILREKNRIISAAARDVKKQLLEEEKSFLDILFSVVDDKLNEYMKTKEYKIRLKEQVQEMKEFAKGEDIIVYINSSDQDKKDYLEQETGVELTISKVDFIGGIRVVIRKKNLMIDHSFLAKRLEEKENYSLGK